MSKGTGAVVAKELEAAGMRSGIRGIDRAVAAGMTGSNGGARDRDAVGFINVTAGGASASETYDEPYGAP